MSSRQAQPGSRSVGLYGEQTRLSLRNFPVDGRKLSDMPQFIRAYGLVKLACAHANVELGVLDGRIGDAVIEAAGSVARLEHTGEFPSPLIQGGGGTSTNMNLNEVIASLANDILARSGQLDGPALRVHPNVHVNASQSTNDTYPTAMALCLMDAAEPALAALDGLREALLDQAGRGAGVRRLGRTCLQDAVSLTVEQTHRAQATIVERSRDLLSASIASLRVVPLGGTVLGTGIGAPDGFGSVAVRWLSTLVDRELDRPKDAFAAMAHLDTYASLADACRHVAVALARVASDLRLLSSGPVGGPAELTLPALQDGSSIMPGKTNPVIPELVMQLSYRIRGNAHTVELAVAAGELELNVMGPVIFDSLMTSLTDLRNAAHYFADMCLSGLRWNHHTLEEYVTGALDSRIEPNSGDRLGAGPGLVQPEFRHTGSSDVPVSTEMLSKDAVKDDG